MTCHIGSKIPKKMVLYVCHWSPIRRNIWEVSAPSIITKASTAASDTTHTAIYASIGKACSTIDDCYDEHVNNMEDVSNENMGLMKDLNSSV